MTTPMDIDALAPAAMGGFPQADPNPGVAVSIAEASGGAPRTLAEMGRQATLTQIYRASEEETNSQLASLEAQGQANAAVDVQAGGAQPSRPGNWRSSVTSALGYTGLQLEAQVAKALTSRALANAKKSSTMPQVPYFQVGGINKFDGTFILCGLNKLVHSVDPVVKNDEDAKARIDECFQKMNVTDAEQRNELLDTITNNIKTNKGAQWKSMNGSKIVGSVHAEFGKIFVHLVTKKNGDGTFTKEFWPEVSRCYLNHMTGMAPVYGKKDGKKGANKDSEGAEEPQETLTPEQKAAKKAAKKAKKEAKKDAEREAAKKAKEEAEANMTEEEKAAAEAALKAKRADAAKQGRDNRKELLELRQWKEDNEGVVANANRMDELYTTLSDSFDELEGKYLEVNQALTECQEERDELRDDLSTLQEVHNTLQAGYATIEEERDNLTDENGQLQAKNEDLEKQIAELQAKNEDLEKQIAELQAKNEDLEGAAGTKRPRTRGSKN